jgi:lycopene beta-cyclase
LCKDVIFTQILNNYNYNSNATYTKNNNLPNILQTHFDYIIAGGGCAGLSLAYHLSKSSLSDKKVLIIDKEHKDNNDRTWCFWTDKAMLFDSIVYREWQEIECFFENYHKVFPLQNLRYKIIRGIDFYKEVGKQLAHFHNIVFYTDTIKSISETGNLATVETSSQTFTANFVFDSLLTPQMYAKAKHTILQHFKGYVIQTYQPTFDTSKVTMFDFRVAQKNEVRFFYILPYSSTEALVEFTVFGKQVFANEVEYLTILNDYISNTLKISNFCIIEEEFGIIPMTDFAFQSKVSKHIKRMGIAGGQSKASTGYTFLNIQRDSAATVKALETTGQPFYKQSFDANFKLYDSLLLNIMQRDGGKISSIFADLFCKNPIENILYFLDNQTSFDKDLQIMWSVPSFPFLQSIVNLARMK